MSQTTPPPPPPPASTRAEQTKPVWKRWWFWVAAVVVLVVIAGSAGSSPDDSTSAGSTPTTSPSSGSAVGGAVTGQGGGGAGSDGGGAQGNSDGADTHVSFGDGTWIVGKDIKPGTYRAAAPGGDCYWERQKDFSGGLNSIIANGLATGGPIVVTIEGSDKGFSSNGCGDWSDNVKSAVTSSRTRFGDGIFVVGVDVAPGTYRVDAGNGCYWERMRNFTGDLNSIIANDNTKGSTIVSISSSDAGFKSERCGDWVKV